MEPKEWKFLKYSALTGETVGEYTLGENKLESRSSGLMIRAEVTSYQELQDLAQAISEAWKLHERLRSIVLDKLMGKA